jgi:hypothetical protein
LGACRLMKSSFFTSEPHRVEFPLLKTETTTIQVFLKVNEEF